MAHLNLFCGIYNVGPFPLCLNREKPCGTCFIAIQTVRKTVVPVQTLMIIIYILFFYNMTV